MRWWLGAAALLVLGWILGLGLLVYAMYAFFGVLWLGRHLAARWTGRIRVDRFVPAALVEIGETLAIRLTLHNETGGRIPWLLIEESLPIAALTQVPPRLRATGPRVAVLSLRRGEHRVFEYQVTFLLRGYYRIGPTLLESGDLFGLYRRYRTATEPSFVLVPPKVVPLEGYDLASRRPIGEVRMQHRLFEDPTRVRGIRPYERGDTLNRIHWRASARTGALQSKCFDASCVAGANLLLDLHRDGFAPARRPAMSPELARRVARQLPQAADAHPSDQESAWIELAITTAASLANAVFELGERVGLVTNGRDAAERHRTEGLGCAFRTRSLARTSLDHTPSSDRLQPVTVETRRGPEQLQRILDVLARIEITDGLRFHELVDETASRLPRDATAVAILSQVPEEVAIALGQLRRGGFAVFVVLVNREETQVCDWASPPDWADRLMAEGIPFRQVRDESDLSQLCAERLIR
ncbi:MAG: DUF58 domain-containing protein [Verrucomicrobiae bacterium]|nr:DUF58 domain-containing protein [Verrucomicrobiae bacterium]